MSMVLMTIEEKHLVIQMHVKGFKNSFIAAELHRDYKTIYNLIRDWKNGNLAKIFNRKPRGRPKLKLTAQQVFKVLNYFIKHPFHTYHQCIKNLNLYVSYKTIGNILRKNGVRNYVACKKPFLTMQNQIKRLRFALKHKDWTTEWSRVCFLDEKTIQTYANGRVLVKRKMGERYNPDKLSVSEVQNTKNKVNLVGIVSCNGPNVIFSVSTNFIGQHFEQLMRTKIKNIVGDGSFILMDNARIHSKGVKYLLKSGIHVLKDYPPKSPDINIIENVWALLQKILNRKMRNVNISTKDELLKLIEESWKEIPVSFIIKMKGRQTKY